MISLEQIRALEGKVHAAVSRIRALAAENATLKDRLGSYEGRIAELETLVLEFKSDQEEIEAGIVAALRHLDELEDTVSEAQPPVSADAPAESEQQADEPQSENEASELDMANAIEIEADEEPSESTEEPTEEPEDDEPELDIF